MEAWEDETSIAILGALMRAKESNEATDQQLMRYILGTLSDEEEEFLIEALVSSPKLRGELIDLQNRTSKQMVSDLARDPSVGLVLVDTVRKTLDILASKLDSDKEVPRSVWRLVGQAWGRTFAAPKFAYTRSADRLLAVAGTERRIRFSADVVDGDIKVEMECGREFPIGPVTLALQDPAGSVLHLWKGDLVEDRHEVVIGGIGAALGFERGRLPNSLFLLTVEDSYSEQQGYVDLYVSDQVVEKLPLAEPITIRDGLLRLNADVATLCHSEPWTVHLYLQLGSASLFLGHTELSPDDPRLAIVAGIPQIEDCLIWGSSLFSLRRQSSLA